MIIKYYPQSLNLTSILQLFLNLGNNLLFILSKIYMYLSLSQKSHYLSHVLRTASVASLDDLLTLKYQLSGPCALSLVILLTFVIVQSLQETQQLSDGFSSNRVIVQSINVIKGTVLIRKVLSYEDFPEYLSEFDELSVRDVVIEFFHDL